MSAKNRGLSKKKTARRKFKNPAAILPDSMRSFLIAQAVSGFFAWAVVTIVANISNSLSLYMLAIAWFSDAVFCLILIRLSQQKSEWKSRAIVVRDLIVWFSATFLMVLEIRRSFTSYEVDYRMMFAVGIFTLSVTIYSAFRAKKMKLKGGGHLQQTILNLFRKIRFRQFMSEAALMIFAMVGFFRRNQLADQLLAGLLIIYFLRRTGKTLMSIK